MTQEQLEKGKALAEEIMSNKVYLDHALRSQIPIEGKEGSIRFMGIDLPVRVPKTVSCTIIKLIIEELTKEISRLENEFESL